MIRRLCRLSPLCVVLLVAATGAARGQSTVSIEGGVRATALGGAVTALPGDVWGMANPAVWATLPGRAAAFFAGQAFGLAELRTGAVRYVEPTRLGAFAVGARTFGFEDFRESRFSLGFARAFSFGTSRRFYAGVNVRYHHVRQGGGYGSAGAVGVALGVLVSVLPRLHLGLGATGLGGPSWAHGEDLPQTLSIGLCYAPGSRVKVLLDAFKDLEHPISIRAGLEVWPVEQLALRVGAGTKPTRLSAGVGVRLDHLRAGIAAERHHALGWSPAAGLSFVW